MADHRRGGRGRWRRRWRRWWWRWSPRVRRRRARVHRASSTTLRDNPAHHRAADPGYVGGAVLPFEVQAHRSEFFAEIEVVARRMPSGHETLVVHHMAARTLLDPRGDLADDVDQAEREGLCVRAFGLMRFQITAGGTVATLARHAGVRLALEHGPVALDARAGRVVLVAQADRLRELRRLRRFELFQRVDVSRVLPLRGEAPCDFCDFLFLIPLPLGLVVVAVDAFVRSEELKALLGFRRPGMDAQRNGEGQGRPEGPKGTRTHQFGCSFWGC